MTIEHRIRERASFMRVTDKESPLTKIRHFVMSLARWTHFTAAFDRPEVTIVPRRGGSDFQSQVWYGLGWNPVSDSEAGGRKLRREREIRKGGVYPDDREDQPERWHTHPRAIVR